MGGEGRTEPKIEVMKEMADKEGDYCTICGGIVPKAGDVRTITVDGKAIGVRGLDRILETVAEMDLAGPAEVREALLSTMRSVNYIPTKKSDAYADALYAEYLLFTEQG